MRQGKSRIGAVAIFLLIAVSLGASGCASTRPGNAAAGVLGGALVGAGLGAAGGAAAGNPAKGAVIGAIAGAILGGIIGANQPVVQQPVQAYNYQPWQEGNGWCCRDNTGRQMWYNGQQWTYNPPSM